MSDKYGYIGIETLLSFCNNDKNHCVTPNDFMRMNRVKIDERPHGEWICISILDDYVYVKCSECGQGTRLFRDSKNEFCCIRDVRDKIVACPYCGADMRKRGDTNV